MSGIPYQITTFIEASTLSVILPRICLLYTLMPFTLVSIFITLIAAAAAEVVVLVVVTLATAAPYIQIRWNHINPLKTKRICVI
jgi:hypothetical protein